MLAPLTPQATNPPHVPGDPDPWDGLVAVVPTGSYRPAVRPLTQTRTVGVGRAARLVLCQRHLCNGKAEHVLVGEPAVAGSTHTRRGETGIHNLAEHLRRR